MDQMLGWDDPFHELILYPFGLVLAWNMLSLPIGLIVAVMVGRSRKKVAPWLHRVAGFCCGLHIVAPLAGLVTLFALTPFAPMSIVEALADLAVIAVVVGLPALGGLIAWRSVWRREIVDDKLSIREADLGEQ